VTGLLAQATPGPGEGLQLVFLPVAPELVLVGAAMALMLFDALYPRRHHASLVLLSLAAIALAAAASLYLWVWVGEPGHPTSVLGDMVLADKFAVFFRLVILGAAALGVLISSHYLERAGEVRGEFYPLLLLATAGMTLIVAAGDLILVFLALEILSLALYLLTGFSFRRLASAEASMKYFLLGAFSSAFFLYGIAFVYGTTGTTNLSEIALALTGTLQGPGALALIGAGLLAVGFCFKVSAVPFHMWAPDAYQGAPTSVTAFMAAGTKVAAFAAFVRVFQTALVPLIWDWQPFVWALAAITMVVGSALAIAQKDIKRMLAYSSIAQAGFILVGLTAGTKQGIESVMFYLVAYPIMVLGAFTVVMLVSVRGERNTSLTSYAGLARRSPFLAAALTWFLLSLAGIPPTVGFIAKVGVFVAAAQAGEWPLVLIAVLASVVAVFFYLRVVVLMYMQDPAGDAAGEPAIERTAVTSFAVVVPAALVLLFGVLPGLVARFLDQASLIRF
jgi:NADH-quinone oxidoreductase subunit N